MKTALITGTNRGIGLELTRQLLEDGWRVHATARDPEESAELKALTFAHPDTLQLHALDVADAEAIRALSDQLAEESIDWLINNAGVYGPRGVAFGNVHDVEAWLEVFRINSIAPMLIMQAFAEQIARSEEKKIGILSSKVGSMGDNGSGGGYIYRSSKAAVNAVIKSASIDLEARGINVVALHPGWVLTDMGGPNAEITTAQSAEGLRRNMADLTEADRGRFIDIDGTTIPW
ncbi:SDR family oxidoreductase [Guyparkeria halophila]|uniref:SDR family oxidoreductase n=1 Tax=Guyparkeria halophila TaxID=47960 RepID=A0ABZ0YWP7_9GAMM|nr:SDR family oxidoreductase [Guyparkeria halophila]WQH16602.1 SDR family oxidoreductase [Guyparkeria halophila]